MASDTRVWDKIREEIRKLEKGANVKVGVLQSKAAAPSKGNITMVELAAIHEFGAPSAGIPKRSFIFATFRVLRTEELVKMQTELARGIATGEITVRRALGILGSWGSNAVKSTIKNRLTIGPEPQENAPSTIARKGSSTPLVDTGRLLGSISYEVDEEGHNP